MTAPSIFISYRRDDSPGETGRIYDRLAAHFGAGAVFRDLEGIRPGQKFAQVIEARDSSCAALVAVIGPQWLSITDKKGNRRLEDPADWVRQEVVGALKAGIVVIPALVQKAKMPQADDLPSDLKQLAGADAVEIYDELFDESVTLLVSALEATLKDAGRPLRWWSWRRGGKRATLAAAGIAAVALAWAFFAGPLRLLFNSPISIETSTSAPKRLPVSLIYSLRAIGDKNPAAGLYWFRVDATNRTKNPFTIKVNFKVNAGPVMPREGMPFKQTIQPRQHISLPFDPNFRMTDYKDAADLEVECSAVDDATNRPIGTGTDRKIIHTLPRNVVAWDLTTPDNEPVPQDLLLASLSAWTQHRSPELRDQARQLFNRLPRSLDDEAFALQWFSISYRKFFRDPDGFGVIHLQEVFAGEQEIRVPEDLLRAKRVDPLEAALFLVALSNAVEGDLRVRPVLLALQDEDAAAGGKAIVLAWSTENRWHGLDLAQAATLTFEQNEPQASRRVAETLATNGTMLDELKRTGVYISEPKQTIAVDLKRAAQHFGIQPLP